MLNSYNYKVESKVVAVTKEIEKTISPDKVTEMYDKMREEVENCFVRKFVIKSDILNGIVVELRNDFENNTRKVLTRIVLNGKEFIFKDLIETEEILSDARLYEIFSEHYTDVIKNEILKTTATVILKN
jgi:hypothetical protein